MEKKCALLDETHASGRFTQKAAGSILADVTERARSKGIFRREGSVRDETHHISGPDVRAYQERVERRIGRAIKSNGSRTSLP